MKDFIKYFFAMFCHTYFGSIIQLYIIIGDFSLEGSIYSINESLTLAFKEIKSRIRQDIIRDCLKIKNRFNRCENCLKEC